MSQMSLKKQIIELIDNRMIQLGLVTAEAVLLETEYTKYQREILPETEEIELL